MTDAVEQLAVHSFRRFGQKMPASEGLSFRIISHAEHLAEERAEWNRLVDDSCEGNPLLRFEWHETWLRHFGHLESLCYVRIALDGVAVAYFPMHARTVHFHRIPCTALMFIGRAQGTATPIVSRICEDQVCDYFIREVVPTLRCDLLIGLDLPTEYSGVECLTRAARRSKAGSRLEEASDNWIIQQETSSFSDYMKSRPAAMQREMRRREKRFSELGAVTFRLVNGPPTDSDFNHYTTVYARSWKGRESDEAFFLDLMKEQAAENRLRLGILFLDTRPIALCLSLVQGRRAYVLKTAYDEEFSGAGILVNFKLVERLMADDQCIFVDYLRGSEAYKKNLANKKRQRISLFLFQKTKVGKVAFTLDQVLLPRIRRNRVLCFLKEILFNRRRISAT